MTETYFFDAAGRDKRVTLSDKILRNVKPQQLIWIDAERNDEGAITDAAKILSIDEETLKALLMDKARTQLTQFDGYFTFSAQLPPKTGRQDARLDFVIAQTWLLTVRDCEIPYLAAFRDQDRAEAYHGHLTPAALAASLLDRHLDSFQLEIADIQHAIDKIDNDILTEGETRPPLRNLSRLHRQCAQIRRLLAEHRPLFHGLLRADFSIMADDQDSVFFRDLEQHFELTEQMLDRTREMVVGSFELYSTRTAQDTNELLKALTITTVIIGSVGAIAGVFGMNFETPYSESGSMGFYVTVGAMAMLALSIWKLAVWRNWLGRR